MTESATAREITAAVVRKKGSFELEPVLLDARATTRCWCGSWPPACATPTWWCATRCTRCRSPSSSATRAPASSNRWARP
ncbi:hypothetical protein ACR6C2_13735 [Streptomyces sp. INA 01156]